MSEFHYTAGKIALRAASSPDSIGVLAGYAAVYFDGSPGTEFRPHPEHVERFAPGLFDDFLEGGGDVLALSDHSTAVGDVIGRRSAETLRLRTDKRGLAVEIDLPDTRAGRDLHALVSRGDVRGMSVGFPIDPDKLEYEFSRGPKGELVRTVTRAELHDVAPVAQPAYKGTTAAVRSFAGAAEFLRQERQALLEAARKRLQALGVRR